ncbi:MAG: isoaspartyl peptidase/L-asparaginase [Bacteroidales bacterium]|nr:isoaspartyl peptidase/L-asparaginase [Bacteroidales bacterium]
MTRPDNHLSKIILITFLLTGLVSFQACLQTAQKPVQRPDYAIVIHGGAGVIEKSSMTPAMDSAYRSTLSLALSKGAAILESGGTSVDAVIAAITLMEDSPLFNAGRGAVYNEAGFISHDASLMEGAKGQAAAVGAVTNIKNPILAAYEIMKDGRHVFMVGEGAEKFAAEAGLEVVDPAYFFVQRQRDKYEKTRQTTLEKEFPIDSKHGTVGAVALDRHGNLAAGTSTGGMHYKRVGRLGDSPVIGAGTWAENGSCAVSATGHGEFFIRNVVAYDIAARMKYAHQSLDEAAEEVVMKKLAALEAGGGIIAVDSAGNIALTFNTPGMFRGYKIAGKPAFTGLYADEH